MVVIISVAGMMVFMMVKIHKTSGILDPSQPFLFIILIDPFSLYPSHHTVPFSSAFYHLHFILRPHSTLYFHSCSLSLIHLPPLIPPSPSIIFSPFLIHAPIFIIIYLLSSTLTPSSSHLTLSITDSLVR